MSIEAPGIIREGTPKPKGIHVRIEEPDLIFKAAELRISGLLEKKDFDKPINNIQIGLTSGKDNFHLSAKISTEEFYKSPYSSLKIPRDKRPNEVLVSKLSESFNRDEEEKRENIFNGPNKTKFIISDGPYDEKNMTDMIQISTGTVTGTFGNSIEIFQGPVKTEENMNTALKDMAFVLETTVKNIYWLAGKEAPDKELILRAPDLPL